MFAGTLGFAEFCEFRLRPHDSHFNFLFEALISGQNARIISRTSSPPNVEKQVWQEERKMKRVIWEEDNYDEQE